MAETFKALKKRMCFNIYHCKNYYELREFMVLFFICDAVAKAKQAVKK